MTTDPHHAPPLRHDTAATVRSTAAAGPRTVSRERLVVVLLAVATVCVFGVVCTGLGIGITRTVNPCRYGCAPTATRRLAELLLVFGPAATALVSAWLSLRAMRLPHRPRPWLPAVLGCVVAILVEVVGSVGVHAV